MTIEVQTIGGVDVTFGGRVLTLLEWNQIRGRTGARGNLAFERSHRGAAYTGSTYPVRQVTLWHVIQDWTNADALLEEIEGALYGPMTPAAGDDPLVMVFEEGGVEKWLPVVPVGLAAHGSNTGADCVDIGWWIGTWDVLDPVAYAVAETTTGAGASPLSVSVAGTLPTAAVEYDIVTSAAKAEADGQRFRRLVTIANRSSRPLVRWPVLLTPTGWNHGAEVTATDSLASGADVEAYVWGRRVPVWSSNWNAAATMVWTVLDMPAGRAWTLAASALSGATTLEIAEPLTSMPGDTFFVMNAAANVWRVTAWDPDAGTFTVEDAQRDSSASALTAGDKLWWVPQQGLVDLVWGWTGAPAPAYDEDTRPIVDMGASANTGWQWAEYYEPVASGNVNVRLPRAGAWVLRALGQYDREFHEGDGDQYWRTVPQDTGTPGAALALDYRADGPAAGQMLADRWDFESAIGLAEITFTWTADNVRWAAVGGPPIKLGRLSAYAIDEYGQEVKIGDYDLDVTAGTGSVTFNPASPLYAVSFRWEPYDRKLAPTDGAAIEPTDGEVWSVDSVTVSFEGEQQLVVHWGATDHDIYQVGRPNAPATLTTTRGTLAVHGAIVDVGDTLTISADDRSAVPDAVIGVHNFAGLLAGPVPELPADTSAYPTAGTATVTYAETGSVGVTIGVRHYDAWA